MCRVIYFNSNQIIDRCVDEIYFDFLDYAFQEADYFMLVYVNYYGKGYTERMKYFMKALKPYQIKSRRNPTWPGTLNTFCVNTTYKIIFYRNVTEAKEVLKETRRLSDWSPPHYPQDLAFFKKNKCWFYSVGHENIGAIIRATDKDIAFVKSKGLAAHNEMFTDLDGYYNAYDEFLVSSQDM